MVYGGASGGPAKAGPYRPPAKRLLRRVRFLPAREHRLAIELRAVQVDARDLPRVADVLERVRVEHDEARRACRRRACPCPSGPSAPRAAGWPRRSHPPATARAAPSARARRARPIRTCGRAGCRCRCRARRARRRRSSAESCRRASAFASRRVGDGGPQLGASGRRSIVARIVATTVAGSACSKNGSGSQTAVGSPRPITVAQYRLLLLQQRQVLVVQLFALHHVDENVGARRTTAFWSASVDRMRVDDHLVLVRLVDDRDVDLRRHLRVGAAPIVDPHLHGRDLLGGHLLDGRARLAAVETSLTTWSRWSPRAGSASGPPLGGAMPGMKRKREAGGNLPAC